MRVFLFVIKKRKRALRPDSLFFSNDSDIFLSILILIIASLAIHSGVFYGFYFFPLLASRLPPFDRKTLKNCACSTDPGLLDEIMGSLFPLFLSFFISKRMGKTNFFFYKHINIQLRRFFSELVESKSCGKFSLIMI